jgi:RND family efflux transporter MFP subunit
MISGLLYWFGLALFLGICAGLTGCSQGPPPVPPTPPPTVTVSYPLHKMITDYAEFPGLTAAVDTVQVRARVSGYLEKTNFKEGDEVKQGQVLFRIDPRPYKAAVEQAQAQLDLQQAQLKYNQAVYQRNLRIRQQAPAVAKEAVQESYSQQQISQANVEAAQANLKLAQLNLNWTDVKAPISGLVGRFLVTPGNLITADQTVLTTLVSQDPMYAYFDVDEPTVLKVQQLIREGKYKGIHEQTRVPVFLGLQTEKDFPHEGLVDFINNQVNPSTGTLQIRGSFANPKPPIGPRLLSPGLFVRIKVAVSAPYEAILVPQDVVGTNQNLKYVYVVNDQNRVVRQDVTLGAQWGQMQVIASGLKPDQRVVINGLQHVRPGVLVKPKLVPMPTKKG